MSVIIYTTPSCSYCRLAKDYFRQNGITFTEYNVAADMRKADEMVRKSGQMGEVFEIALLSSVINPYNSDQTSRNAVCVALQHASKRSYAIT